MAGRGEGQRILLFDRDIVSARLLSERLKRQGYGCVPIQSFEAGMGAVESVLPHLILLDIDQADAAGYKLLVKLRERWPATALPVIVCSSRGDDGIARALRLGADDSITKPIRLEIALARLSVRFQLQEAFRLLARKEQLKAVDAVTITCHHEMNNPLAVAIAALDKLDRGARADPEMSRQLPRLRRALERICETIRLLQRAVGDDDIGFTDYRAGTSMLRLDRTQAKAQLDLRAAPDEEAEA